MHWNKIPQCLKIVTVTIFCSFFPIVLGMNSTNGSDYSIIFIGTPDFSLPSLQALLGADFCRVLAVISQPDKPAGRGQQLSAPPVKKLALEYQLPVFQPSTLKNLSLKESSLQTVPQLIGSGDSEPLAEFLNQSQVDAFVTCAYAKIIPPVLLRWAPGGMINVHPSLLPRWRGAAPLQRTLLHGDKVSGVCLMQMDEGLDTGAVYCRSEIAIAEAETFGSLHDKLSALGAKLLLEKLPQILSGQIQATPQSASGVTYAEKWEAKDQEINWLDPADTTLRRIRACAPVPGTKTFYQGENIKIHRAHLVPDQNFPAAEAGSIVETNKAELIIACPEGRYLAIDEMQFPGKSRLPISEVLRGRSFKAGQHFGH